MATGSSIDRIELADTLYSWGVLSEEKAREIIEEERAFRDWQLKQWVANNQGRTDARPRWRKWLGLGPGW
jgi:hypothetical protein